MTEDFSLCDDTLFRGVFGEDASTPFLTDLVNSVLRNAQEEEIQSLTIKNPFQLVEWRKQKEPVLDISARDNNGCWFDLEIQVVKHPKFRERLLYYWARLYSRQLKKGVRYNQLRRTTVIVFTRFPIWPENPEILYDTFQIKSKFNFHWDYSDHLKIHFVTIPDYILEAGSDFRDNMLRNWLKILNYPARTSEEEMSIITEGNPMIQAAAEKAKDVLADPLVLQFMEAKRKYRLDQETIRYSDARRNRAKGRKKGLEEGLKKGLEEGLEKGLEKGLEEGLEKGLEKGRLEEAVKGLLNLIEWSMGKEVPAALRSRIERMTDLEKIGRLSEQIVKHQVETFNELEAQLPE